MSSVQFNLLPDSKLEFNRTQSTKRMVLIIGVLASAVSLCILLAMLGLVDVVQKKMMNDAQKRVDSSNQQLKQLDVDKIITVQNQLKTLPELHDKKHIMSHIFTYLPAITPPNVSISELDIDLAQNTLKLSGTAPTQKDVNTFIDTLKYATYKVGSNSPAPAFQGVVESGFGITTSGVGYSIDMTFDPQLFQNMKDSQGSPVTPTVSVDKSAINSPLSTSSTLFNGSTPGKK